MTAYRRDDRAVTEVLGFILMFAMSSLILIISLRSFNAAQDNSDDLVTAVELRNIANRISSRMVQAAIVSQEFPEAEFKVDVKVPMEIAGYRYSVALRDRDDAYDINDENANPIVYAQTEGENLRGEGSLITGEASTFRIDEALVKDAAGVPQTIVLHDDPVLSSAGVVRVHYWYDFATGRGQLELTEGNT